MSSIPSTSSAARPESPTALLMLLVFAVALAAQWTLASNPGYLSHDELQWASFAAPAPGQPMPWVGWLDIAQFQYRPLTFNLWLALSARLFTQPAAFHLVFVAWGALNAALLCTLLRRLGATQFAAVVASLLFALGPYAAYVHGWVGTLGDLMWVGCVLLIGLLATRMRSGWGLAIASAILTGTALLAKEAALSIPALLLVMTLLGERRPAWRWALVGATTVAIAYLAARFAILANADQHNAAYRWSFSNLPARWIEYQVFLPQVSQFEPHTALRKGFTNAWVWLPLALWVGVVVALAKVGPRWALGWIAAGLAALGPVLVLDTAYNQYGYGFAAVTTGIIAVVWSRLPRWGRGVATVMAVLVLWHGVNVMREVRRVGEVQAVFSPALAEALRGSSQPVLRLAPAADAEDWIFKRLTHEIPSYRGVPMGNRVQLVPVGAPADLVIAADGRLLTPP